MHVTEGETEPFYVPGVSEFTGQSIGLPTALPGSGEAARGLSPLPSIVPLAQAGRWLVGLEL